MELTFVADVMATCIIWLADGIAKVADVIATSVLADDIAMVVDVKTTQGDWCFGRCYCHSQHLFQFKFWDVKQNLIPYVWQMVLANIPIKGWIISPDV